MAHFLSGHGGDFCAEETINTDLPGDDLAVATTQCFDFGQVGVEVSFWGNLMTCL